MIVTRRKLFDRIDFNVNDSLQVREMKKHLVECAYTLAIFSERKITAIKALRATGLYSLMDSKNIVLEWSKIPVDKAFEVF